VSGPTPETRTRPPAARAVWAVSRPIGPGPSTSTRSPGETREFPATTRSPTSNRVTASPTSTSASSLAARLALANAPAYSAAKGGVEAFTRAAAKELPPEKVRDWPRRRPNGGVSCVRQYEQPVVLPGMCQRLPGWLAVVSVRSAKNYLIQRTVSIRPRLPPSPPRDTVRGCRSGSTGPTGSTASTASPRPAGRSTTSPTNSTTVVTLRLLRSMTPDRETYSCTYVC